VRARATTLVVEDDDGSREMLALALADHGLAVEVARDGAEGLARLEGPGVDLVVLDFRMLALDGAGFMRELRARPGPRPPVLLITAGTRPVELAAEIGADAVLPKPFDLVDLYRAVDALLGDRAPRARQDDR
jgi:DNA-binding response OmpR family regulator